MKKYVGIMCALLLALAWACASQQPASQTSQPKETPKVASSGASLAVQASNAALKPAAEELDVFPPSLATVSRKNRDLLGSKIVRVIGDVVNKVPEGYVVQITGHSAKVRLAAESDEVSVQRAKVVYDILVRNKVDRAKLTYRGVGNSQPREGFADNAPEQRRVTFQVVPK